MKLQAKRILAVLIVTLAIAGCNPCWKNHKKDCSTNKADCIKKCESNPDSANKTDCIKKCESNPDSAKKCGEHEQSK